MKNFVQENCSTMAKWLKRKAQELAAKRDATRYPSKRPGMLYIVTRDRGGRDDVMRKSPQRGGGKGAEGSFENLLSNQSKK